MPRLPFKDNYTNLCQTAQVAPEPSRTLRWVILIFVSIVIATNYYVYDAMSSIKSVMQSELNFSNTEYGFDSLVLFISKHVFS